MSVSGGCEHTMIIYRASTNEDGWLCSDCGKHLGFRPDLDKKHIEDKAMGLLMDLDAAGLVYVSNGTEGDAIAYNVAKRCRQLERYDQHTILQQILDDPNLSDHADYWAQQAKLWCGVDGKGPSAAYEMAQSGSAQLPGFEATSEKGV